MKIITIILCIIFAISLTACIPHAAIERLSTPFGDLALPTLEYQMTLATEATAVLMILETHMTNGKNVERGEYPLERESGNVAHSLVMVEESIRAIAILHVPHDEEDNTTELLRRLNNARNSLELYHDDLIAGNTELISSRVNLMRGDFVSITGMLTP